MSKKIAISQSNYIPWKGYFDMINMVDVFVIYDEVQYTKNDWRNRNVIKTKDGTAWITIPVNQKTLDQTIDETLVASNTWHKKHWKTLQAVYGKAPFFKAFKTQFEALYLNISSNRLTEINRLFIQEICTILGIKTTIISSRDLHLVGDRNERLLDACTKLSATTYLSGPAAKTYLDSSIFNQQNIEVEWMEYSGYPEYQQMHLPFEHGVSILDLLFNEGAKAQNYLKSFT